jgi:hypothetical protein
MYWLTRSAARRTRLLGPDHPDTLGTTENALIVRSELGERTADGFRRVLLGRLRVQGPGHPRVGLTMANLLRAGDRAPASCGQARPSDELPGAVRLEGDHVDDEIDLQQLAIAWQDDCTTRFGPDDPRSLMATCYLGYALAAADHLDGQIDWASVLVEESWPALADAAGSGEATPDDLEIATLIRDWVHDLGRQDRP